MPNYPGALAGVFSGLELLNHECKDAIGIWSWVRSARIMIVQMWINLLKVVTIVEPEAVEERVRKATQFYE